MAKFPHIIARAGSCHNVDGMLLVCTEHVSSRNRAERSTGEVPRSPWRRRIRGGRWSKLGDDGSAHSFGHRAMFGITDMRRCQRHSRICIQLRSTYLSWVQSIIPPTLYTDMTGSQLSEHYPRHMDPGCPDSAVGAFMEVQLQD